MSMSHKGKNHPMFGKHHTKKSKEKNRISHLGKKSSRKGLTYEKIYGIHKANMLKNILHKKTIKLFKNKQNHPMFGKRHTNNSKRKQRESAIKRIERNYNNGNPISPSIGVLEKPILDDLEKQFKFTILRQYYIDGYWLDGYCKELNIAIEIDEPHHKRPYVKKHDMEKEEYIKDKLKCKFIRISVK